MCTCRQIIFQRNTTQKDINIFTTRRTSISPTAPPPKKGVEFDHVFWVVMLCCLAVSCQCFRETYCLHLQGDFILKMEAIHSSETLVTTYQTWSHNPEDHNQHLHHCEGLWTQIFEWILLFCFITDVATVLLSTTNNSKCTIFQFNYGVKLWADLGTWPPFI
jgi:hypothetical protein